MHTRIRTVALLIVLTLPLGYCVGHASRAESKAQAICSAIELNASFAAAEAVVSDAGIPVLAHPTFLDDYAVKVPQESMMIVFPSGITERWICGVQFSQGRVVKKGAGLVD